MQPAPYRSPANRVPSQPRCFLKTGVRAATLLTAALFCLAFASPQQADKEPDVKADGKAEEKTQEKADTSLSKIYGRFRGIRQEDPAMLKKALDAVRQGDVDTGYRRLERMGEDGSADAYFHLGEIERLGILKRGKNNSLAISNYRMAAAFGHKQASLSLANMLYFDQGINADGSVKNLARVQTAIATWQQLALEGDREAMYMLGMLYWNGDGIFDQDPIRGYGLVWGAGNKGYKDAIMVEGDMLPLLNYDARMAGRDYARALDKYGFSSEPLRIDLMFDSMAPAAEIVKKRPKPVSWNAVWHFQLGVSLKKEEAEALNALVQKQFSKELQVLQYEILPDTNRLKRYALVFGPMQNLQEAVNTCIIFKKKGIDCFANAPQ